MIRLAMRSLLAATLCAALAGLTSQSARAEEKEPFGRLGADEVERRLGEKNFYLYDNNARDSFVEGHVPKAKWIAYDKVSAADLPADKSATLVFYCANEH